jgi:ribosome-associated protein
MPLPDRPSRRRRGDTPTDPSDPDDTPVAVVAKASVPTDPGDAADAAQPPSKTRRKADMHALQDLGEALVGLDARRFDVVVEEAQLPERLVDAIRAARSITAHGGRRRQLQYVGKLMRGVDPAPIRARLDAWAEGRDADAAKLHALERLRERLLTEPAALDDLVATHPTVDRPRLRSLIAKAKDERARSAPPHAFRELWRALRELPE